MALGCFCCVPSSCLDVAGAGASVSGLEIGFESSERAGGSVNGEVPNRGQVTNNGEVPNHGEVFGNSEMSNNVGISGSDTVRRLKPVEVFECLQQRPRDLLVDIRSSMEYLFVGHPVGAVHVPWIDEPDWVENPQFVPQIRKLLLGGIGDGGDSAPNLYLICRSGKRSLVAGKALLDSGIRNVYSVDEGFEGPLDPQHRRSTLGGWRFHGLPWEQC